MSTIVVFCVLCSASLGDVVEIDVDTTLDPSKVYGPLVIKKPGVTIDGRGAVILGAKEGDPKTFKGAGIFADGVDGVTLRNVKVKGFETGLHVKNAASWKVEECDFSDNFHDPEFGWGEQGRRGGILWENVSSSTIQKCKANRVWDACSLVGSDNNRIVENDFSHTSNTCLKLWHSSVNNVEKNNLSYGLRIKQGEVHARDSTGVLIESGSNVNSFIDNDVTHGGDGIFVRVLNGWVSVGNLFEKNDCSYANNNGFEAWSPHNIYRKNKANYCSYGFWLGASDYTVLEGNEASWNGDPKGFHNSPHLPKDGHAGIVFMFGSSSHTRAVGNICKNNNGAGIALIGEPPKFKAYHWILESNVLENNRWGIYARHADWIDLADNTFARNREAEFSRDDSVTNVFENSGQSNDIARWSFNLKPPKAVTVGKEVTFELELNTLRARTNNEADDDVRALREMRFRWDFGDGPNAGPSTMKHTFKTPGLHRIGITSTLRGRADLSGFVIYALDDLEEINSKAAYWTWADPGSKVEFVDDEKNALVGSNSTRALIRPYSGGRTNLVVACSETMNVEGKSSLVFWLRTQNENIPGWQGPNPVVTLKGTAASTTFTPKIDRLAQPVATESRDGWTRFEVPLKGDSAWERTGELPTTIRSISIGLDSWGADPFTVWIDGIAIK